MLDYFTVTVKQPRILNRQSPRQIDDRDYEHRDRRHPRLDRAVAIASDIAEAMQSDDRDAEQRRTADLRHLEQRQRAVIAAMDRGYEDFVSGRISDEFWRRK